MFMEKQSMDTIQQQLSNEKSILIKKLCKKIFQIK